MFLLNDNTGNPVSTSNSRCHVWKGTATVVNSLSPVAYGLILNVYTSKALLWLLSSTFPVRLPLGEWPRTLRMINQHNFRWGLRTARFQAITWKVDWASCHHMTLLGHNEVTEWNNRKNNENATGFYELFLQHQSQFTVSTKISYRCFTAIGFHLITKKKVGQFSQYQYFLSIVVRRSFAELCSRDPIHIKSALVQVMVWYWSNH